MTIFLIDAASCLIPVALLLGPLRRVRTQAEPSDTVRPEGGYREILRRPAVLWLTLLTFIAVFIGYGQMEGGFPAFAREVAEVPTRVIGFAFAINTAVIVLLQFFVLARISGRRRTRVMIVMAAVWAASWVILGASGLVPGTLAAAIGVLAFMGVFALGETMLQPTVPGVYNDLASDHNRGRYNAINSAAFQLGAITGPFAAGLLLGNGLGGWYIAVMVAGCATIAALALALERRLSLQANGVAAPESEEASTG
jgi:MFS family permease